jgi:hypothetical protein
MYILCFTSMPIIDGTLKLEEVFPANQTQLRLFMASFAGSL